MKKMTIIRISSLAVASTLLVGVAPAGASVFDVFTEDLNAFDEKVEDNTGSEAFFGNVVVPPVTVFNDGNALHMYDLAPFEKPEVRGEYTSAANGSNPALTGPFRIDFQSNNMSIPETSKAIRFRMANFGKSITSESRSAFSLSWQADGDFTAKYSGVLDGDANDVDTLNSDPLVGVQSITMIANGATAGDYSYTLFGGPRTLHPLHYDIYINGVLLNNDPDPDFANGMQFHTEKSATDYNPALGLSHFGLVGSSDSDVGPDYLFDNILIKTGSDIIPEPSMAALVMIGGLLIAVRRERRG
jgi:hypothetical protein